MRTSAYTAAILALTTLATTLSASDDFSALLADLSFGDAPSLNEPLAVAEEETLEELRPVPTGITMPDMVESTPVAETTPEVAVAPQEQSVPHVALKDPVPLTTAELSDQVDFDDAFALQNTPSISPRTPATPVSHLLGGCEQGGCDSTLNCRPRQKVCLPSSTFLQYFRSNACYTNVWDGYRQHCGKHHKHLHGECDCFNQKSHGCSRGCSGCEACDAACSQ